MRELVEQDRPPDDEDRTMAQTDQAWDWGVELRDEERSELDLLRRTVAQLRTELDQAQESLRSCRQRQQDARQALRQLDEARLWRRAAFERRCENVSCCKSQWQRPAGRTHNPSVGVESSPAHLTSSSLALATASGLRS